MFLPTTREEMRALGWEQADVILVTGDSYIDSPYIGAALIGKLLLAEGFRVGIIAQPALDRPDDIARLGAPALFWGVTAGCVDSMVANYTALGKKRRSDDYTPGGRNERRPDRAVIAYTNLIRRHVAGPAPVVLGGIEASLRRVAHYDFWTDRIRRSVLFDAKADFLVYGMGERAAVALARTLREGGDPRGIRGLCYAGREVPEGYHVLPAFDSTAQDPAAFTAMFHAFYRNMDPRTARGLAQLHDTRYLIQNPPAEDLSVEDMDRVYALQWEREQHPYYARLGSVRALDTIRFSIPTHRGCYGECSFCAISVHEGRTVQWRSEDGIVAEAEDMARHARFRGVIQDVGGPTANMYGYECAKKLRKGVCATERCVFPGVCHALHETHAPYLRLLRRLRGLAGVRKVFVASGIRHDLVLHDEAHGEAFVDALAAHHTSGQLKLAPEHCDARVLALMGKPGNDDLLRFRDQYLAASRRHGKEQFLTYYFIAAHPGCGEREMEALRSFASGRLRLAPEQVQIFTPTPSTYAALMYHTGRDPFTGAQLFVEKTLRGKMRQKERVQWRPGGGTRGRPARG